MTFDFSLTFLLPVYIKINVRFCLLVSYIKESPVDFILQENTRKRAEMVINHQHDSIHCSLLVQYSYIMKFIYVIIYLNPHCIH